MIKKVVCLCSTLLLVSCASGNGGSNQGGAKKNYQIGGNISSVYYDKFANVQIKYKDEVVFTSNEDGNFNGTISLAQSETFLESNLSFELPDYDFVVAKIDQRETSYTLTVKGNNDEGRKQSWGDSFCTVGGKVVYHWGDDNKGIVSGETPLVGTELYLNNHLVKTIDETGNFDLDYVMKGAILTAKKEGFYFVDRNATPYNDVAITEDIGGLTFRAIADE